MMEIYKFPKRLYSDIRFILVVLICLCCLVSCMINRLEKCFVRGYQLNNMIQILCIVYMNITLFED